MKFLIKNYNKDTDNNRDRQQQRNACNSLI